MIINGMSGTNTQAGQMGMSQTTDAYSRNIQNQIVNAQKQLQELSADEEMTLEEKMKKKQEIQQQISNLNMQLRQHQIEQRREKQRAKGAAMDEMLGGTRKKADGRSAGLSKASMTAMISADASMKQAKIQGGVAAQMQGRANVLKVEIKQSGSTKAKEEELADLEQKAANAAASQMNTLAEANKTVEEAAAAERTGKATEKKPAGEKETKEAKEGKEAKAEKETKTARTEKETEGQQAEKGSHVDVCL